MLENNAWDQIADLLNEDDFHLFDHRIIFRAIADLGFHNRPFDVVTLADKIKHSEDTGQVNTKNITAYIATLAKETPTAANISGLCGNRQRKIHPAPNWPARPQKLPVPPIKPRACTAVNFSTGPKRKFLKSATTAARPTAVLKRQCRNC